jgi:hypothetical protein
VRFLVLLFAAVTGVLGAGVRWGPVENGLQLGIDVTAASEPVLRISLKNAGAAPRDLVVGYEGTVDLYSVEIITKSPGGQEQPVFDLFDLKARSSSLLMPIVAHLQPGEVREFIYPLAQFICVVDRKDVPFRLLWDQGYTAGARFDLPGVRLITPDLSL